MFDFLDQDGDGVFSTADLLACLQIGCDDVLPTDLPPLALVLWYKQHEGAAGLPKAEFIEVMAHLGSPSDLILFLRRAFRLEQVLMGHKGLHSVLTRSTVDFWSL